VFLCDILLPSGVINDDSNYGSILHQFRDKARYWSKIVIFSYPFAFDAPVKGVPV